MNTTNTAILFIFFNRPIPTEKSFSQIRSQRPKNLILCSDGARPHRKDEGKIVSDLREKVESMIDWEVNLTKLYRPSNLGCARNVAAAITESFEKFDRLIIIEDDCVCAPDFFEFCNRMLDLYEHEPNVQAIAGTRLSKPSRSGRHHFSGFPQIWGWALWKRGWDGYRLDLSSEFDSIANAVRSSPYVTKRVKEDWIGLLKKICANPDYTWDHQLILKFIERRALAVVPPVNLVKNVGYGADATHTVNIFNRFAGLEAGELPESWEVQEANDDARRKNDVFVQENYYFLKLSANSLAYRITRQLRILFYRTRALLGFKQVGLPFGQP